jgi:hypothetical protein
MSHTTTVTLQPQAEKSVLTRNEDEIYTIDDLIKRRASELQDAPLLCYPQKGLIDYEEHSALAIDRFVDAAAAALQQRGLQPVVCLISSFFSRRDKKLSCLVWRRTRSLDAVKGTGRVSLQMLGISEQ